MHTKSQKYYVIVFVNYFTVCIILHCTRLRQNKRFSTSVSKDMMLKPLFSNFNFSDTTCRRKIFQLQFSYFRQYYFIGTVIQRRVTFPCDCFIFLFFILLLYKCLQNALFLIQQLRKCSSRVAPVYYLCDHHSCYYNPYSLQLIYLIV